MRLPSPQTRRILFGVFLVLTPLWGPALDLTGPDYTYESTEIVVEDNRLVIPDEDDRRDLFTGVAGFACFYDLGPSRYCTLEATTLNGRVEVDNPNVQYSSSGHLSTADNYLTYYDGRVFAYNSTWEDGHYVLWTERVSAAAALETVADPASSFPDAAVTAVREGTVTTDEELWPSEDGARVVELDGEFYLVYQSGVHESLNDNAQFEELLTWFAVVFGAAMLFGRDSNPN
ncbi:MULTISPECIES: hypothetical protein [Haloferax]|uniref:Uncharacterized protein n=2 Tax=Haloferax TaxID=2251 RepID=A0A6G1YY98_9EURY|nr:MULTISPECIES: hypothetical protein [Haloferax]KAB1186556.1 hypothetical protein Hfx1149_00295 [Haloferax sp. CBA1149]MRW79168.1 hypothetical protein [Haloferax marinisediminis]